MIDQLDRLKSALADRYTIERELGRGGMATVYLAHDLKLGRHVALKVLRPELAASLGGDRFVREIEIAAKLTHPNILALHDCGGGHECLYYTMPYVEGESLRDRLNREKQLSIDDALQITREVADALGHAHSLGIVHRDIKPENILFTAGHAVVSDFGIARAVSAAGAETLTETGLAIGTPAYMSPEQASASKDIDARTDIYSLGCVLYEMLAGEPPFTGPTAQAIVAKKLSEATPRVSIVRETVPSPVEAALAKALAKTPADRFGTAQQFVHALERPSDGMAVSEAGVAAGELGRKGIRRPSIRRWALPVGALVVTAALVALDVGGLRERLANTAAAEGDVIRLAVLPFENLTGDPEQEYLSDGLTEEMIAQLGRMHPEGLSVIGRQSVMRYEHSDTPIDQIGRDLNVDYVLAGSARWDASTIRIRAELIRVEGQTQVWTEAYESEPSGVLALQSDVVSRVAESLALELLPSEAARLASARSVDPAAYEAYLRGTHSRRAMTPGALETAERYFRRALEIDPEYAAAWAGISRVWNARGQMGMVPPKEAIQQSKQAVLRALAIDETEWEAHRSLASILTWGDWDWQAAERQWNRVLKINSNAGGAYSHFLMHVGRPDEAMAQIERALELDPFNLKLRSFYVIDLVYVGRYDDAIAEARDILRLQPDNPVARSGLTYALVVKGMFDEALEVDRARFAGDAQLEALERGYAEAGYTGAQQRIADLQASQYGTPGGPAAYGIALRYLYAGNRDRALEWLEQAYEDNDGNMPYLGLPIYDSLRSDPRFQDLLRRMNLPS
jgi:TolB-like protein/Tfp pilus assembly protein PilF